MRLKWRLNRHEASRYTEVCMSIADNLVQIEDAVGAACRRSGRPRSEVSLMAVSKVHPVEAILEAHTAGQRLFGENRVQEFAGKSAAVASLPGVQFHLIGPLQSNKTAKAAELFHSVDTVNSLKTAQRLDTAAAALGKRLPILIEVKLSHEESKHGLDPAGLPEMLDQLGSLGNIVVSGLMTVPPWSDDPETARPYFQQLRRLRDENLSRHASLVELSMGMSNDFAVAIEEGSTTVRIGTAIFGRRVGPVPASEESV